MKNKVWKEVILFILVTLFLSYFVFWGPLAVFKVPAASFSKGAAGPVWSIILFIIGGFVPSIVGIVLTAVFEGKKQTKQLLQEAFHVKIGFKWFAIIISTTLVYAITWIILCLASGGNFKFSTVLEGLPTILPLLILGPLSEEYGWRGFALKRLLKIVSPNVASLVIGIVWSFWHIPLFYLIGTSQYQHKSSFLIFLVCVISQTYFATYFYIKTNQNLFTAILVHWLYTYLYSVVADGIGIPNIVNTLELAPAILFGLVFVLLLSKKKCILIESPAKECQ